MGRRYRVRERRRIAVGFLVLLVMGLIAFDIAFSSEEGEDLDIPVRLRIDHDGVISDLRLAVMPALVTRDEMSARPMDASVLCDFPDSPTELTVSLYMGCRTRKSGLGRRTRTATHRYIVILYDRADGTKAFHCIALPDYVRQREIPVLVDDRRSVRDKGHRGEAS